MVFSKGGLSSILSKYELLKMKISGPQVRMTKSTSGNMHLKHTSEAICSFSNLRITGLRLDTLGYIRRHLRTFTTIYKGIVHSHMSLSDIVQN